MALRPGAIDPATFTAVRLGSGALALTLLSRAPAATPGRSGAGSWPSALFLFAYALPFSFAYVQLGVATGALVLFLSVQATMLAGALLSRERIHWLEGIGILAALAGLVFLVLPGLSAPDPFGAVLMAAAGVAWGVYSLRGRGSVDPIRDTAANFVRSSPLAVLTAAALWAAGRSTGLGQAAHVTGLGQAAHVTLPGLLLAVTSGVIASGAGYAAWFAALPRLGAVRAAALQLTVPVIAAAGGILLLSETLSSRLLIAAGLILGGVGLALGGRSLRSRAAAVAAIPVRD